MKYDIKDISLAKEGDKKISWASKDMPVLNFLREKFSKRKIFNGTKIGCCLHVTKETANLLIALKSCGADVFLCASNPLSTQDDVASAMVKIYKIPVFAIRGEDRDTYYRHIHSVLGFKPDLTVDDGADLVSTYHKFNEPDFLPKGGTEETTTGVMRLRSLGESGKLLYPIIAVNDAKTKYLFDNRYGTGQSTIDGIMRATNMLIAGKNIVVFGYGWCGRGIALRTKGLGANVCIVEVNPLRALEAVMDGFLVMNSLDAAKWGEIFITATGNIDVLDEKHFLRMRDGVILANSGHFNVEINIPSLKRLSKSVKRVKPEVEEYKLKNGKRIFLLSEGRLVNLSAGEGHPASVMDMSFSNQFLSLLYLLKNSSKLEKKVYSVPEDVDATVARLKLKSMGIKIDKLTDKQKKYISSWELGT